MAEIDPNESTEIVSALQQAFETFNEAAHTLSVAYAELEQKLESVNKELEEANQELRLNLQEKQRLHHYLVSILNSMRTGVVVFDLDGRITVFNRDAEQLTGLLASDVVGRQSESVFGDHAYHHPEPHTQHDVMPEWLPADRKIPLDLRTELVKDTAGEALGVLLLMEDISSRKQLEEQVRRTTTLAALGKMAAEIVHEIRNPLAAMQIYARILQQELDGESKHLAEDIMAEIQSLDIISGNMLSLTRPVEPRFECISLADVIESALEFSIYAVEEHDIELIRKYPRQGLNCEGDFQQLKQVALNLVLNAIQAMPEGGTLEIKASPSDNQYLVWQIKDTGCGIPEEHRDRIFTPFFSSRQSGTGLGLHTVERILQTHGATIRIESEVGKGTEFTIHLPIQRS